MAFKFSKAEIKERDEMVSAAREKLEYLNKTIGWFNDAASEQWGEVEDAMNDYNGALSDARDFLERVRDDFTGQYDDKSEKWQEGENGVAAREWLDTLDFELYDAEIEQPDSLDEVVVDELDTLENLSTEAGS